MEGDPLQLDYTKAGVILELISDNPPGPPYLSELHQHRYPGDYGAEVIIIFKSQDPP